MKFQKLWLLGVINLLFVVVAIFFAQEMVEKGRNYNKLMHEHVEVLTFKDRLLNQDEWVLLITGKVIKSVKDDVWLEKKLISEQKLIEAQENYDELKEGGNLIFYLIVGLVVLTILIYAGTYRILLATGGSLVSASLVLLYLGIYTPLLEIHAYDEDLKIPIVIKFDELAAVGDEYINKGSKYVEEFSSFFGMDVEIPEYSPLSFLVNGYQYDHSVVFEGRMYYYFQSKSIDSIIDLLFKDKNYTVGMAILCFSFIFPLFKILLTFLLVYSNRIRRNPAFNMILTIIGKWSMADIFVAAIFLAYFSFHNMNTGIQTASESLIGLDFFLGYAVISIIASILVWAATKKETKLKMYESVF